MKNRINSFFKNKIVLAAVFAAATLGLGGATIAQFGPDRPTKQYVQGQPGFDYVTFNSFTGVPNIGDERNFLTGKIAEAPNGFYDPMNQVRDGNEILVRVYVHNNADENLNTAANGERGIARNTRVRAEVPKTLAQAQQTKAYISADNAQPKEIFDTLDINAAYPFELDYVEGSASLTSNFVSNVPLSDEIVKSGVRIGDDQLDGNVNGCFEFVALVSYKVKVKAPNFNVKKTVRLPGENSSMWREEATATPGSAVEWKLEFTNTGATQLNNVDIFDELPAKMSIVPGSTTIYNGKVPNGVSAGSDNVVRNGIDVGDYASNSNAIVVFKAKVPEVKDLSCGRNTFLNKGYARPEGQATVTDNASVIVNKECQEQPKEPIFACDLLRAEKLEGRKVRFTASASASNGATIQRYVYNFGDGSPEMITDKTVVEHTYSQDGTYATTLTVQVRVGNETKTATGPNCAAAVTFTSTPPVTPAASTTPSKLPDTGAGSVVLTFMAVAGASSVGYYMLARRSARI